MIAITGITDSGSAVATVARMLPTVPDLRFTAPAHSIPARVASRREGPQHGDGRPLPDELGTAMELSMLRQVYEQDGPFVTVYLEGRSPAEDAGEQVRLRWRALRERLESAGAEADALDTTESALVGDPPGAVQADGRVLVATGSGIILDEPWDASLGAGDDAHWGVLPPIGPYVREVVQSVRELVVITDQNGAQVRQE